MKKKKLISSLLAITMTLSCVHINTTNINAQETDIKISTEVQTNKEFYNYIMFAGNIDIKSENVSINGKTGSSKQGKMIDRQQTIIRDYFSAPIANSEIAEYFDQNITLETLEEKSVGCIENIMIYGDKIKTKDIVLYSKEANININCDEMNFSGLIYAPKGKVNLTGKKIHLDAVIIADEINMTADSVIVNENIRIAKYLGTNSDRYTEQRDIYTYHYDEFTNIESIYIKDQMLVKYIYTNSFNSYLTGEQYANDTSYSFEFEPVIENVTEIKEYESKDFINRKVSDTPKEIKVINSYEGNKERLCYTLSDNGEVKKQEEQNGNVIYTYDDKQQLVRVDDQSLGISYAYKYDERGNIIRKTEYEYSTTDLGEPIDKKIYSYDSEWLDKLNSFNKHNISYDEVGNPISYKGWNLDWEAGRQLASAENGEYNILYSYDVYGVRTGKTVNGNTITYKYIDGKIMEQHDKNNNLIFKYDDETNIIGVNINGEDYYFIKGLEGDVQKVTDSRGMIVAEYKYDAWGKIYSITGKMSDTIGKINPIRYRSYYYVEESGLYYLQSRYYDPETCRFINSDDFGFAQYEINLYRYCSNNPVKYIDPTGYLQYNSYGNPIINSGYDSEEYEAQKKTERSFLKNCGFAISASHAALYIQAYNRFHITTKARKAHYLAQCFIESDKGNAMTEYGSKSYFNDKAYGYKYRGSGYIQITWDYTYKDFADYIGDSKVYSSGADYVAENYPWLSAGWYWDVYKKLNTKVDNGASVKEVTKIVNGGTSKLDERKAAYNKIKKLL